jgi:hypothetical protein
MTRAPSLHAQVWAMAGPIVLANVSVPLLGAVVVDSRRRFPRVPRPSAAPRIS